MSSKLKPVKIFINMFAFLYLKANSVEICEEISAFLLLFRKMLMSAFLLRFKANYLKQKGATPVFL